tara:strand:- start:1074 stop:1325 length:252 start_codon:yes stop_codon:yes gene_type:complete
VKTLFLLSLLSSNALADEPKQEEPQIVYKQKTEIDFEGLEIDGELVKPQGSLLLERRGAKFNPMIKLRIDFDDEMEKSVQEIK